MYKAFFYRTGYCGELFIEDFDSWNDLIEYFKTDSGIDEKESIKVYKHAETITIDRKLNVESVL